MKECAELSICNNPIGISLMSTETVIYKNDLNGSNVPRREFMKLNRTISLLAHVLFPVRGSLIHYL